MSASEQDGSEGDNEGDILPVMAITSGLSGGGAPLRNEMVHTSTHPPVPGKPLPETNPLVDCQTLYTSVKNTSCVLINLGPRLLGTLVSMFQIGCPIRSGTNLGFQAPPLGGV